jgi:hypothetical protein
LGARDSFSLALFGGIKPCLSLDRRIVTRTFNKI